MNHQIFFEDSQLPARWGNAARFVVLDTCFDAGQNFFATWVAWRDDPARPQQLHYLAIADSSFSIPKLSRVHSNSSHFISLLDELRGKLPPLMPGFHRILLNEERVVLTLIMDEVNACLPQIEARVDAFFLSTLLDENSVVTAVPKILGRLAAPQATLVCQSASKNAHLALEQAGFVFESTSTPNNAEANKQTTFIAHFSPRWAHQSQPTIPERKAIVIGAGLAGSAACERLATRGWQLTLIERHAQPAQEASGNLAGIYMPLMSKDDNATARLTRAAYFFAVQMWQRIGGIGGAFSGEACGVLQLARDAEHALAQRELIALWKYPAEFVQWLDATEAGKLLGHDVLNGTCLFPQAGWAHPAGVCRALLARYANQIETRFAQSAMRLERVNDQWHVHNENGICIAQAPIVILANGVDALKFSQTQDLPLTAVRGQVTYVATEVLPELPMVVCGDGYITRPSDGVCSIGASYDLDDDVTPRPSSDVENCAKLHQMLPTISLDLDHVTYQSRVAFRCVSTDRLPLVGALPDTTAEFRGDRLRDVPRLPGLYGLLGYASRGLIWSSLAAELLAAQLEGEPLPLENDLVSALDPARFHLKARRKNG